MFTQTWLWLLVGIGLGMATVPAAEVAAEDAPRVPGVVIAHSPKESQVYLGSPAIVALPSGEYLVSCDEFGVVAASRPAVTRIYRSADRGTTWQRLPDVPDLFWANVFCHRDALYLLGTDRRFGRLTIRRSADRGQTWSMASDAKHGLLSDADGYHTAPTPTIHHAGRLWRAVEDNRGPSKRPWAPRFRSLMMSAAVDADLLKRSSWTFSDPLVSKPKWLGGKFGGWLEGNAVVSPDGELQNLLRVESPTGNLAALVSYDRTGRTPSFDPATDFVELPGGAKKFTIRYDPESKRYWSLTNPTPANVTEGAQSIRNTLALVSSPDLREWTFRGVVLHHPDRSRHGYQYADFVFEGDDLLAAVRTAHDDEHGGAESAHNSNFITFHRFPKFRDLTLADSVIDAGEVELRSATRESP